MDRKFPPIDCEWAEDKGGDFKPDYCALGDALREQIEYRAIVDQQLSDLRSELLGLRYLCAADHGGYTERGRRQIEIEIDKICEGFGPQ